MKYKYLVYDHKTHKKRTITSESALGDINDTITICVNDIMHQLNILDINNTSHAPCAGDTIKTKGATILWNLQTKKD